MAKRFKLRFTKLIPSFLLCRSKHPNRHHTNPVPISNPCLPNPPPSTPISFSDCGLYSGGESNDGDISSTSPLIIKKRVSKRKGGTFNVVHRNRTSTSSYDSGWFSSDEEKKHVEASRRSRTDKGTNFKVKSGMVESVAVEKSSNDPFRDFKRSMMEMIVEKEIVEVRDLEDLLQCFLTLNSREHHKVIVAAFAVIWDALFSDPTPFSSLEEMRLTFEEDELKI